jgi:GNAT superfamily N-acetyltransferase
VTGSLAKRIVDLIIMTDIIRTNSGNEDFRALVALLDRDLAVRDGDEHSFYAQFNKVDMIRHVVVAYRAGAAVSCGAFKEFPADKEFSPDEEFEPGTPSVVEIKRMFTRPEYRGQGIAQEVLTELESWARELGFAACVLETGKKQPEAIRLYQKSGYEFIPNYGQYAGMENSVCMKKSLEGPESAKSSESL